MSAYSITVEYDKYSIRTQIYPFFPPTNMHIQKHSSYESLAFWKLLLGILRGHLFALSNSSKDHLEFMYNIVLTCLASSVKTNNNKENRTSNLILSNCHGNFKIVSPQRMKTDGHFVYLLTERIVLKRPWMMWYRWQLSNSSGSTTSSWGGRPTWRGSTSARP